MKYLIIRNDDVDYFTNMQVVGLLKEELRFFPQTYGITPYATIGKQCFFVGDNRELAKFLSLQDGYRALHGIYHNYQDGRHEFLNFNNKNELIKKVTAVKENLILKTDVFIPPHNYIREEWCDILKLLGFKIFSTTKRKYSVTEDGQVIYDKSSSAECGIIPQNGYTMIPQSFMLKRKYYYQVRDYFEKLLERVCCYYQKVDVLVITVHWWDFVEKGVVDYEYLMAFKYFLKNLYDKDVRGTTFYDASRLSSYSLIPVDFFELKENI